MNASIKPLTGAFAGCVLSPAHPQHIPSIPPRVHPLRALTCTKGRGKDSGVAAADGVLCCAGASDLQGSSASPSPPPLRSLSVWLISVAPKEGTAP